MTTVATSVRSRFLAVLVAVLAGLMLALGVSAREGVVAHAAPGGAIQNRIAFNQAMRKLWEDHITWTRLYIVSAESQLPDTSQTATRLFANQTDIGNAIKPFYGNAAGNELTSLLTAHIAIAAEILSDATNTNPTIQARVPQDITDWYANADQIATFLHTANPSNWSFSQMQTMMHTHLQLTLNEAVDRLQGNYAASVADYDQVHAEILQMADMLSSGIIAQFPQDFSNR